MSEQGLEAAMHAAETLLQLKGRFRNKHLAQRIGRSRQRTTVLLRKMESLGVVERTGGGRGAWYKRGRGCALEAGRGVARGADGQSVWDLLTLSADWFAYVKAGRDGTTQLRSRQQVGVLLEGLDYCRAIVFDLRGIRDIAPTVAEELAVAWPERNMARLEIINALPEVDRALDVARHRRNVPVASGHWAMPKPAAVLSWPEVEQAVSTGAVPEPRQPPPPPDDDIPF